MIYEELEKIEYNVRNNKDNVNKTKEVNISKNKDTPEYRNEINLIYYTEKEGIQNIFGEKFVENNKNNIELNINGVKNMLIDKYNLQKGENKIKIIIKKEFYI